MPGKQRLRLIGIGAASIAGIVGLGYLLLGDVFILVATGMLDRVLSIGSAATTDISLINRFRETAVVMGKVMENPILGYGMGVSFSFWDLTFLPPFHHVTTFLHNGYVALWYKFGIWGLGMVLYFWSSAIWHAVKGYRAQGDLLLRLTNLGVAGILISFVISAITSNPFYINDPMFMFGIATGAAAGARELLNTAKRDSPTDPAPALP
jgi:O-antigen ligase